MPMKKLLTATLVILVHVGLYAQTYQPFPLDETSEWRAQRSMLMPPCWDTWWLNYHISGQLTQGGKEYHIIAYDGMFNSQPTSNSGNPLCPNSMVDTSGIAGLIRAEEGKYYTAQIGEDYEQVYLDFTLMPGDTLWEVGQFPFVVDSVDMVDVNGRPCIRQWFCANESDTVCNYMWAIEGIGHTHGFLNSMYHFESNGHFLCYREHQVQVYPLSEWSCIIPSVETESLLSSTIVFPNPTEGLVRIDVTTPCRFQMMDAIGRVIFSGSTDGAFELDISSHPRGIYTVVLTYQGAVWSSRVVRL